MPSFLYGEAAATPLRRNLAAVRQGQFEGLDARFELPQWRPDFGDVAKHASAGAIAVGAREILIAFNIELAHRRSRHRQGASRGQFASATAACARSRRLGLRLTPRTRAGLAQRHGLPRHAALPYRGDRFARLARRKRASPICAAELIGCLPCAAVRESRHDITSGADGDSHDTRSSRQ